MKKIIMIALALVLTVFMTVPSFAASNTDLILDSLRSGVNVNGKIVTIPANYINQAENFLDSHQITNAQTQYILAQISGAKEAIKEAGITNLSNLDPATKEKILAAAANAANAINLKLTVGSDKKVKISDTNGAIAFSDDNVIKTTGLSIDWSSILIYCIAPFLCITGTSFLCIHKYKLLENEEG